MTRVRKQNLVFILILAYACVSCLSIKPGSVKSGQKYYESFFVGDQGIQYFIKPLEFESAKSSEYLYMDFVFRQKDTLNSIVTVNYSVISDELFKSIDSIVLINKYTSFSIADNKFLFNERDHNQYVSRFTGTTSLADVKILFETNPWHIELYHSKKSGHNTFTSGSETGKIIESLHQNLFILF